MYEKFLEEVGNFVFMENQPESADIIFVPGNSYPYMAEKAAELYRLGLRRWFFQVEDTVFLQESFPE